MTFKEDILRFRNDLEDKISDIERHTGAFGLSIATLHHSLHQLTSNYHPLYSECPPRDLASTCHIVFIVNMHVREVTSVARNLALLIRRIIDQTRQYFDQLASASLSPTLSIDAIMQNPEPPLHLLQQSVRYMIAQLNEQLGSIVSLKIPHILCHQEALSPFRVIEDDISLIQCHVIELVEEFPLFSEALDTLFDTGFKFTRMFIEHQHDEADATRIELMLAFDPQPDDSESDNDDNPTTPPCAPSDLTLYHSNTTEYKDVIES